MTQTPGEKLHAQWSKARASALAAGVVAVLTAGVALPAAAAGPAGTPGAQQSTDAVTARKAGGPTWITLITGDQVAVNAKGTPVAVKRAKGREGIPVQTRRQNGHVYVVPQDATQLIAQGRVDRRLFDVTTLSRAEYRKAAERHGLGLIVTYKGGASDARSELHAAEGTKVTHTFSRLNGESVTAPEKDASDVWSALTNDRNGSPYASAESGLGTVWLNAIQKAALDKSVPQIGAPTAWAAGYDGTGIKIAVLDTGVDTRHPDLPAGTKVVKAENFSDAADVTDHFGHGTHVASIAAGTGAKSGGKYKGVAPGAQIISGKVLDDEGFGDDAGIIKGLEWAAAQGARIVNLSLGGTDTPGVDPIEATVNRLSAGPDAPLFVIAAGNEGEEAEDSTIGSPGSADAALTVGAVDKNDSLADFSSRGPRVGDGAIKPDVTAPGVDITAAAAKGSVIDTDPDVPHPADGYLTISGTSMATPHVAGAAAILAQEHPDWTGQQIKAVLIGSAEDGGYTPFQQGSGRIDVARAIGQSVVAEPASLNFGTALWPHSDDPRVTKTVTYRNSGQQDVTLDLSLTGQGPRGGAAPAGFFALDKQQVTVPAGGTAEATVTVDSTLGGTVDGAYSAYVVATGGGRTVRTAAAVVRETEAYNLTIKNVDRTGHAAAAFDTLVTNLDGLDAPQELTAGSTTLRVPKGTFSVDSLIMKLQADGETPQSADWLSRPVVKITGDTTLTFDARAAKPFVFKLPDSAAKQTDLSVGYSLAYGDGGGGLSFDTGTMTDFRTAYLGPQLSSSQLQASVAGVFQHGSKVFNVAYGRTASFFTGFTKTVASGDLATIGNTAGAPAAGKYGLLFNVPAVNESPVMASGFPAKLPYTRTVYLNATGVSWTQVFAQYGVGAMPEAQWFVDDRLYAKGKNYSRVWNVGVFGPKLDAESGLFRSGDEIYGGVNSFADGSGHPGFSVHDKATTTLYRNGTKIGTVNDGLDDGATFTVPGGKATYRLTTTVTRSKPSSVSTGVATSWTFTSQHASPFDEVRLPASVVRFTPALSTSSTSAAGLTKTIPVTVQGSAAGSNLKSLKVYWSTDGGAHWKALTVKSGKVTLKNPKAGTGVSLMAVVSDKKGNTLSESIYNAYRTQ
ncbi:S8 family serine peptidase [Streptomyces sp. NPDC002574]|uniref:S8 family serine peptidase n=1 Tax=Streptomyces sp. NPDC002574 TaxID=3364652 RepID=UPI003681FC73